jgi:hypothetical protein
MSLNGTVAKAPAGALGFDVDEPLDAAQCAAMLDSGYVFCLRYVSLGPEQYGDLSTAEATTILSAGLALMPVQHFVGDGWSPSGALGTTYGQAAAANVAEIGFPAGVNVWVDIEGVGPGTATQDIIDYANNWYDAVAAAGFVPGLYVGPGVGLTSEQLYSALKMQHYWRAGAESAPTVATRGIQMQQSLPQTVNYLSIDEDTTQDDAMGDGVLWLAPPYPGA